MKFWAYIHKNGKLHTKRYFDEAESIAEAAKTFSDIVDGLAKPNMDFSKRPAK